MYNWLVFLHIFFGFSFMLAHGVHAAAMLAFRSEKDPERSLTFFNIVPQINMVRYLTVLMGLPGFIAAFITPWWQQGWVWARRYLCIKIIGRYFYRYRLITTAKAKLSDLWIDQPTDVIRPLPFAGNCPRSGINYSYIIQIVADRIAGC